MTLSHVGLMLIPVVGIFLSACSLYTSRKLRDLVRREGITSALIDEAHRADFRLLVVMLGTLALVLLSWFTREPSLLAMSLAMFLLSALIASAGARDYKRVMDRVIHNSLLE